MRFNISIKYYTSMKNIIYISKIFPAKRKSYQTNQTLKSKYPPHSKTFELNILEVTNTWQNNIYMQETLPSIE